MAKTLNFTKRTRLTKTLGVAKGTRLTKTSGITTRARLSKMPIYEYQCKACGHRFDALQKVSDAPLRDCPVCAKQELKKLVSAPSFRLKGSGWYETDFKKDNQRNLVDSEKPSSRKDKSEEKSAPTSKEKKADKPEKKNGSGDQAA